LESNVGSTPFSTELQRISERQDKVPSEKKVDVMEKGLDLEEGFSPAKITEAHSCPGFCAPVDEPLRKARKGKKGTALEEKKTKRRLRQSDQFSPRLKPQIAV